MRLSVVPVVGTRRDVDVDDDDDGCGAGTNRNPDSPRVDGDDRRSATGDGDVRADEERVRG